MSVSAVGRCRPYNVVMRWRSLLAEVTVLAANSTTHPQVTDVVYDSRQITPGALFVAMRGGSVDGNRFVRDAIGTGAAAIVTDSRESFAFCDSTEIPVALVQHGR